MMSECGEDKILMCPPGYRALVERDEEEKRKQRATGRSSDSGVTLQGNDEEKEGKPKAKEDEKTKAQKDKIAQESA